MIAAPQISRRAAMRPAREIEQEAAEDVFFGQVVMIWARWFLIAAGSVFFLWTARDTTELALGVLPIVALMAVNFYLHGRYFLERPSSPLMITTASVADALLVSAIVLVWHSAAGVGTGLASPFFVLYYPVLLAFAFVLPRRLTTIFTGATAAAYVAICAPDVQSLTDAKTLVLRLVTMAAMGGLGTFYWRIQRSRRRGSVEVAA
jgi:hypothetical protein